LTPSWLLLVLRLLPALCLAGFCVYTALAVAAAAQWKRSKVSVNPDWTPGITILKPVRGVDAEAYENFVSFCRMDYPADRMQILFGALEPDDPALELACRLQAEFPHHDIGVYAAPPDAARGANRKVCNLLALLPHAKHSLIVLCDSDMRVTSDYLRRIAAPFEKDWQTASCGSLSPSANGNPSPALLFVRAGNKLAPSIARRGLGAVLSVPSDTLSPVGLVTCPYHGGRAQSIAAMLEAISIGADFIPSTFVSRAIEGVSFALGSTIALPRSVLEQIGGFEPLLDELADDYLLGNGVRKAGYEVILSDYVIEDVLGREQFGAMWARRLRWSRTLKVCRPAGYAGAVITYGFALALLFLLAMQFSAAGLLALGAVLALRIASALLITLRFTGDRSVLRYLPLLPLSDLLSFALYVLSFCGSHIVWRGERFRLLPGGKLQKTDIRP
jgi:ceramide glucosyltransferase